MSEHTPGPWTFERAVDGNCLMTFGGTLDGLNFVYSTWLSIDPTDARLISAAPELLEALKLADALLSGSNMNKSVVERKVRAAIAKATTA